MQCLFVLVQVKRSIIRLFNNNGMFLPITYGKKIPS